MRQSGSRRLQSASAECAAEAYGYRTSRSRFGTSRSDNRELIFLSWSQFVTSAPSTPAARQCSSSALTCALSYPGLEWLHCSQRGGCKKGLTDVNLAEQ